MPVNVIKLKNEQFMKQNKLVYIYTYVLYINPFCYFYIINNHNL